MPQAAAMACTSRVLPAPSVPMRATTAPSGRARASATPRRSVSAGLTASNMKSGILELVFIAARRERLEGATVVLTPQAGLRDEAADASDRYRQRLSRQDRLCDVGMGRQDQLEVFSIAKGMAQRRLTA